MLYSGKENDTESGVGFVISKEIRNSLTALKLVSVRVIMARFYCILIIRSVLTLSTKDCVPQKLQKLENLIEWRTSLHYIFVDFANIC